MARGEKRLIHKAHAKPASGRQIMSDEQISVVRNIVIKRKREWRRGNRHTHWFYVFFLLLIVFGTIMLYDPGMFRLSKMAQTIILLITGLMLMAYLLLLQHNFHHDSQEKLGEMVENEIHLLNSERLSKR
ncbi:MAG: hypothetical protein AABX01_03995 [Candidatus Micrarchaeota archaeon]